MSTGEAIPLAKPVLGDREVELVEQVLRSGRLSLGPMVQRFEEGWAERIGVKHAVATSSGTGALHLCVHDLDLGENDEVITSSFSFVASANVALYPGAKPVFAEVDENTFNMDPAAVEAAITPRTKALIIVDIFGYPAEVPTLIEIARKHDLAIIEDACQAIDADYDGKKLGSFGHPATFGFYANKQMTTAEGGIILTDDDDLANRLRSYANQGRSDDGQWLQHSRLGFNYRLSDVHSAIGVAQLERFDDLQAGRARAAGWYQERVAEIDGVMPMYEGPQRRSWFVFAPRVNEGIDRNSVMARLENMGIAAKPYLPSIHLQPFYVEDFGHAAGELPITERISASTLSLPFFAEMTEAQVDTVCTSLAQAIDDEVAGR